MSRMVSSARSKVSFETAFNTSMCMSNAALAKVQFKIDKERARHQHEVKMLDRSEKAELRLAQREMEEVKKELHALKAYKFVARKTAFRKFDPVELRKQERRERRKQESLKTSRGQSGRHKSHASPVDDQQEDGGTRGGLEQRRRSSASGEVFVTLQDIMDNDDVLRRHSMEIVNQRRKSLASLEEEAEEDENRDTPRKASRVKKWLKSPRNGSATKRQEEVKDKGDNGPVPKDTGVSFNVAEKHRRKSRIGLIGELVDNAIREDARAEREEEEEYCEQNVHQYEDSVNANNLRVPCGRIDVTKQNYSGDFFITSGKGHRHEDELGSHGRSPRKSTELRPMTIFQMSKMYEKQQAQRLEENENKLMHRQRAKAQREYEVFRIKLQLREHQRNKALSEKATQLFLPRDQDEANESSSQALQDLTNISDEQRHRTSPTLINDSEVEQQRENDEKRKESPTPKSSPLTPSMTSIAKPKPMSSSAPLSSFLKTTTAASMMSKSTSQDDGDVAATESSPTATTTSAPVSGLTRFKNAATAVSVQQKVTKGDPGVKMKNLAAALMIKANTTRGRVPGSFLSGGALSWTSPRDDTETSVTALEASHRNPDDVKVRPLKMPLGVQAEHERKWSDLMSNVQYAVYWKVKALRENTGTVNPRQMRRLVKENPVPRKPLFPGACKTTWAMKNYVKQEVGDVLKSWRPENLRKKRNRELIDRMSLPKFIDRVRTTTSILRSFRQFRHEAGEEDDTGTGSPEVDSQYGGDGGSGFDDKHGSGNVMA